MTFLGGQRFETPSLRQTTSLIEEEGSSLPDFEDAA
jgi:hypothetical protein